MCCIRFRALLPFPIAVYFFSPGFFCMIAFIARFSILPKTKLYFSTPPPGFISVYIYSLLLHPLCASTCTLEAFFLPPLCIFQNQTPTVDYSIFLYPTLFNPFHSLDLPRPSLFSCIIRVDPELRDHQNRQWNRCPRQSSRCTTRHLAYSCSNIQAPSPPAHWLSPARSPT